MRRAVLTSALALAALAAHAQEFATSYNVTEVRPGIHMLEGADGFSGGNVGLLVGDERVVMIDDAMVPTAPPLLAAAREITGRPVDFVVNTHVHGDHAGGNAMLAETGTVVFAHDNIRKRLVADPAPAGGPGGIPIITFADGITFHINGLEARVFHVANAHTDGDAVIHFPESNVIHTGDIMFNGLFPFIDLDNGGSVDGYIAAQHAILALADLDTVIIPGHGPLAKRSDLERTVNMLIDARARVQKLVDEGKTESEILAANPLSHYDADWSWSFITTERMTQTLIRALMSSAAD